MAQNEAPRTQKAGRIRDARGRKVTQLDPVAIYLLRQHYIIDADALQAIANEEGVRIAAGEPAALIGGPCGALLVIGLFTHTLITGDMSMMPVGTSPTRWRSSSVPTA